MATKENMDPIYSPGWEHPEKSKSLAQRMLSMAIVAMMNARPGTYETAGFRNPETQYEAAWNALVWSWWKEEHRIRGNEEMEQSATREIERYVQQATEFGRKEKVAGAMAGAANAVMRGKTTITKLMPH